MSSRKLNALEQKIHQAVLAAPNATLSQKEIDGLASDAQARTAALNFLLGAGMFKALSDAKGRMVYRGVVKKELDVKKDMSGEEKMILGHIQASANEGIWTKHIKAKTELHQTVIDRCIKSLTQKQLIKAVKSVKYPTRKIFMMFHLDPSVEMTGGPWYTDNELDTEFIKLLCRACLQFIKDRSFPRARKTADDDAPTARRLYSISAAPAYPTSQQIQSFLSKSKITETELTVEHVEMLLNVLTLDGEVERLPAFGAALWSSNAYGDDESSDEEMAKAKHKKEKERARKRKRSSHGDDDSDASATSRKSKKSKSRKSRDDGSSESEDERRSSRKSSKKRRKGSDSSDSDDGTDDGAEDAKMNKRSGSKSKKRGRATTPPSDTSSDTLDSDSDEQSDPRTGRKAKSSSRRRSPTTAGDISKHKADDGLEEAFGGAAHVYRALRPERVSTVVPSTFMSWSSQTPCARCPVFDFCKQGGPVNPGECEYYGDWLQRGVVQL